MDYFNTFRVKPGSKVALDEVDASYKGAHETHAAALPEIEACRQKIRDLQYRLYAEKKHALLICLQGRDAAGKDGTINHVLSAMNPQGCTVTGFKVPTKEESAHDFLWRYHKATPGKGHVAIFNRSHYEDVLVVRVHDLVPERIWRERYAHINAFEALLRDCNTHVLKFYLHISPEEELRRFAARIDTPSRRWKISEGDYAERPFWGAYTKAFEAALSACSTEAAPWFVIPANHKWFRNLAVSRIVCEYLDALHMTFPAPSVDIEDIRARYHAAEDRDRHGKG
ncbi:MAG: polyphosphate kinase 2 family protein [Pseudomonadota bacterium]